LLSAGKLKVFESLKAWLEEFRMYRRDEKGQIVKANDHLMDATRYLIVSGRDRMRCEKPPNKPKQVLQTIGGNVTGWMS
jgi:hypothetical protein